MGSYPTTGTFSILNSKFYIIIEEKGILKIIPKKKIELAQFFDTLDFGEEILEKLEDWTEFEKDLLKEKYTENAL